MSIKRRYIVEWRESPDSWRNWEDNPDKLLTKGEAAKILRVNAKHGHTFRVQDTVDNKLITNDFEIWMFSQPTR